MTSRALPNMVRRLTFFAVASLLAISCGSFAIWQSGAGTMTALGNLLGWGIGFVVAIAIVKAPKIPKAAGAFLVATIFALIATFADSGLSNVHRWISVGPLRANIAALLLPAFVAIIIAGPTRSPLAALAWLAAICLLFLQPDASQATALAIASPLLFVHWPLKWRWPLTTVTVAIAAISWLRPDPLQPVAEVEGIIELMWQIFPGLAVAAIAAIAATIIAVRQAGSSAAALAAYCCCVALMPTVGHFPVPLAGAGIAFPLGWWLGAAISLRDNHDGQSQ